MLNVEAATISPWWQTLWFVLFVAMLIIASVVSVYFYKMSQYKKQKRILECEVAERTKDLKNANILLSQQKETIQKISDFGKKVTATLDLLSINNMIYDYIGSFMDASNFGIGIYNPLTNSIDFPVLLEYGKPIPAFSSHLSDSTSCAAWCYLHQKEIFSNDFLNEYSKYISKLILRTVKSPGSVIYLPLTVEKKNIGVVTVQSYKRNAYTLQDYAILQAMVSYIAIALDNTNVYSVLEKNNEQLKIKNEIVYDINTKLEERQQCIEEQAEELKVINDQLLQRQYKIEEQARELKKQTIVLKEANILLVDKQRLIQLQTDKLAINNQQLSVLNSTKDKFFSIIGHDLRNPFNTVIGFSELLLKNFRTFPEEKIEKYLGFIYNSSINGNDLLNNLLLWSRSQMGSNSFKPENFQLSDVILDVINLLEGNAHNKNIKFKLLIDEHIDCRVDENMLKTIIRNLISNAIKFTPEKGTITVKTEIANDNILVTVSDTGVGIPKENQEKLFQLDTNVSTRGTANESGTGIGLVLCKEFVEKHGGKIWVESKEGIGSNFIFTIPLSLKIDKQMSFVESIRT